MAAALGATGWPRPSSRRRSKRALASPSAWRAAGATTWVGGAGMFTPPPAGAMLLDAVTGARAAPGATAGLPPPSGAKPWRRRTSSTAGCGTGGAATTAFCAAARACCITGVRCICAAAGMTACRLTNTACGTTVTACGRWRLR